jgi:iron transport multicopper oxidase
VFIHRLNNIVQHTFSVVRSAGSTKYNYDNPVRRDTVSTGNEKDNVTIRFVTDNTGPWFLHWYVNQLLFAYV